MSSIISPRVLAKVAITFMLLAMAGISFIIAYLLFTWNKWVAIASFPVTAIAQLYIMYLICEDDPLDKKHLGIIADFIPVEGGGYKCYHEVLESPSKLIVFKNYVLRVLSVQLLIGGTLYAIYRNWWPAILTLGMAIAFFFIGEAITRHEQIQKEADNSPDMPLLVTCCVVTIISCALYFHHNLRWYLVVPLTLATGILYPVILFLLSYRLADDAMVRRQRSRR